MTLFQRGAPVRVEHVKPWKATVVMTGAVGDWTNGLLTILRSFTSSGGRYDTIGERILPGDHGTIEIIEGGWVLRRTYARADGRPIGELFNIQTPAEFGPGVVRYTDLEVVARYPDGRVEVVDVQDLETVVRAGAISRDLADTALAIAQRLAEILCEGGDWREADAAYR